MLLTIHSLIAEAAIYGTRDFLLVSVISQSSIWLSHSCYTNLELLISYSSFPNLCVYPFLINMWVSLSFYSLSILFPIFVTNMSIIWNHGLENDSYPKAATTEDKGKFVSKCHFCDLNPVCRQISSLGTLGPFRSDSQKSGC